MRGKVSKGKTNVCTACSWEFVGRPSYRPTFHQQRPTFHRPHHRPTYPPREGLSQLLMHNPLGYFTSRVTTQGISISLCALSVVTNLWLARVLVSADIAPIPTTGDMCSQIIVPECQALIVHTIPCGRHLCNIRRHQYSHEP